MRLLFERDLTPHPQYAVSTAFRAGFGDAHMLRLMLLPARSSMSLMTLAKRLIWLRLVRCLLARKVSRLNTYDALRRNLPDELGQRSTRVWLAWRSADQLSVLFLCVTSHVSGFDSGDKTCSGWSAGVLQVDPGRLQRRRRGARWHARHRRMVRFLLDGIAPACLETAPPLVGRDSAPAHCSVGSPAASGRHLCGASCGKRLNFICFRNNVFHVTVIAAMDKKCIGAEEETLTKLKYRPTIATHKSALHGSRGIYTIEDPPTLSSDI